MQPSCSHTSTRHRKRALVAPVTSSSSSSSSPSSSRHCHHNDPPVVSKRQRHHSIRPIATSSASSSLSKLVLLRAAGAVPPSLCAVLSELSNDLGVEEPPSATIADCIAQSFQDMAERSEWQELWWFVLENPRLCIDTCWPHPNLTALVFVFALRLEQHRTVAPHACCALQEDPVGLFVALRARPGADKVVEAINKLLLPPRIRRLLCDCPVKPAARQELALASCGVAQKRLRTLFQEEREDAPFGRWNHYEALSLRTADRIVFDASDAPTPDVSRTKHARALCMRHPDLPGRLLARLPPSDHAPFLCYIFSVAGCSIEDGEEEGEEQSVLLDSIRAAVAVQSPSPVWAVLHMGHLDHVQPSSLAQLLPLLLVLPFAQELHALVPSFSSVRDWKETDLLQLRRACAFLEHRPPRAADNNLRIAMKLNATWCSAIPWAANKLRAFQQQAVPISLALPSPSSQPRDWGQLRFELSMLQDPHLATAVQGAWAAANHNFIAHVNTAVLQKGHAMVLDQDDATLALLLAWCRDCQHIDDLVQHAEQARAARNFRILSRVISLISTLPLSMAQQERMEAVFDNLPSSDDPVLCNLFLHCVPRWSHVALRLLPPTAFAPIVRKLLQTAFVSSLDPRTLRQTLLKRRPTPNMLKLLYVV